ncbi:MAG: hypothetical protein Q8L41_03690 [Anaerolineales bacterium]|nr:hypothetical protein [Anaerolineales bacterium]
MKADRKTTKLIGRGKSKTQKAQTTHQVTAPKHPEKMIVHKNKLTTSSQIENILERVSDGFVAFDAEVTV